MHQHQETKEKRLAMLRRLYHHLTHGGKPTDGDEERVGEPVTLENLSRLIGRLERETQQGETEH